ncbi:F169A protein, partial [Chunga burmeisteri]|nr:F169A protein [Chunga burmeisteri]
MLFPVDLLTSCSHEDLESSAGDYLSRLRCGSPNHPEFLSLSENNKVPISLSTVGFIPLYGEEQTRKVLALFAPGDLLTAVALYLADQWWSIDDVLRTSVPSRQGLRQVETVGERIVLYVLNRIIYRTQEMARHEVPFLCHGSNDYAKIMWKNGEAIGFYSVKPTGKTLDPSSFSRQNYKLPVLDTMFVRKKHHVEDSGLIMLEDFVKSFDECSLGLRYPLSSLIGFFVSSACKQYLEKHPRDQKMLWEVEGAGFWFQRTSIMSILQKENVETAAEASQDNTSLQAECHLQQSAAVSEASGQETGLETQVSVDPNVIPPFAIWTRSSLLKRPRIGKSSRKSEPETSPRDEENTLRVSESRIYLNTCCRLEPPAHTSGSSGNLEVSEENTVENEEETSVENEGPSVSEAEVHVLPPEKLSEEEETPSEPLNGEVTEETGRTSLMAEEETADEVLSGESELQSESQGEEPLTLFVPLILESPAKPSEDAVLEKVLNANDSEVLAEEGTSVEKEGTEEEPESEKMTTENAAALASKEEPSDNGPPNSMVMEAGEESVSENVSPKTASSLEDQNEEAGHNLQEAPVALSQSSLIVVELEGVSFQQPSGQEGPKNQLEEHSESAEQMDQYPQTAVERAADSSSEEAEIEVPIVDRRNLRRKAKGCKGPPKKKGKPA